MLDSNCVGDPLATYRLKSSLESYRDQPVLPAGAEINNTGLYSIDYTVSRLGINQINFIIFNVNRLANYTKRK
jgi:hypothetical protein